ncbi:GreA/GreB family elongation factor [Ferdinandcohnia quinoae]|uniref:GreA/GreB family elongation factor n=1 Tax=Fredinandcohnia quinoae TaxID=2918902 RepID=A0AAW5E4N9_9BACI|nr:GreA/GreB family elongation factor [Fredinandcohnia sp. SECRCQ15]MCH1627900.1 GreA/GreB family elongation factor [Fredinandcohnia sp. SECRCQ15]
MNHNEFLIDKKYFLEQVRYIDENIQDLNHLYISSTPPQERVKDFYSTYVSEIEQFLAVYDKNGPVSPIPKVFIGTKVTVLYEDDGDTEEFYICLPKQSNPDEGYISFLSPVGRQLLLKNIGEKISLTIPSGALPVSIKQVTFVGNLAVQES